MKYTLIALFIFLFGCKEKETKPGGQMPILKDNTFFQDSSAPEPLIQGKFLGDGTIIVSDGKRIIDTLEASFITSEHTFLTDKDTFYIKLKPKDKTTHP